MKKIIILLFLVFSVLVLAAEELPGFYLDSLNLGFPVKKPISHYSGFSDLEVGFGIQPNFKFRGSDVIRIFASVDGTYNFNSTDRIDHLIDANASLGLGFEINPGGGGLTITPQLSAGMVIHILNGDFMLDGNKKTDVYIDQLYRFQLEMAYTFNAGEEKKTHVGLYLSPSFEVFPGESYWGFVPGGSAGVRFSFDPRL